MKDHHSAATGSTPAAGGWASRPGWTHCCVRPACHPQATYTPQTLHTAVKCVTLNQSRNPMQHAHGTIPGTAAHRVAEWSPALCFRTNTRRHAIQHPTYCNIYAEEADGTRQGSSPPRRALCVSCSGGKPTTCIWGQVSAPLGCARLGLCRCSKAEHPRRMRAASPRPSRTRPGFGWQNVALKSGEKNPPNQTS